MTRILIVDDHEVVRDGVKKIFEEQPGTTAFGDASTFSEALQLISEHDWDIVVLDLSLDSRCRAALNLWNTVSKCECVVFNRWTGSPVGTICCT